MTWPRQSALLVTEWAQHESIERPGEVVLCLRLMAELLSHEGDGSSALRRSNWKPEAELLDPGLGPLIRWT